MRILKLCDVPEGLVNVLRMPFGTTGRVSTFQPLDFQFRNPPGSRLFNVCTMQAAVVLSGMFYCRYGNSGSKTGSWALVLYLHGFYDNFPP